MRSHSTRTSSVVNCEALKALIAEAASAHIEYIDCNTPSIRIKLNALPNSDKTILRNVFLYMLLNPNVPLKIEAVYFLDAISRRTACTTATTLTDFATLGIYYFFIINPVILSSLTFALQEASIEFNVELIVERIAKTAMQFNEHDFSESVILLYDTARQKPMSDVLKSSFAQLIMLTGCLTELIQRHGRDEIAAVMISVLQTKKNLLHAALSSKHIAASEIDLLIEILKPGESSLDLYTEGKSSLLHVCKNPQYYSFALRHTANINETNRMGMTPLDVAVREDDAEKTWFLLRNGAQWKRKSMGAKPPILGMLAGTPLSLFEEFSNEPGITLSSPPESMEQRGQYCGLNAAASVMQFFQRTSETLKNKPYCPARKSDIFPPASTSIRHIAKHILKMTEIGEMYSATQLGQVLKHAGCQYDLVDVAGYSQFKRLIETALTLNLPVLIPHVVPCKNPDNTIERREHWATIIGCRTVNGVDLLLTAQYGAYASYSTTNAFEANTKMTDNSKGGTYVKWNGEYKRKESIDGAVVPDKEVEIQSASLADFRGKLLIAMPPEFEIEKWHAAKNVDSDEACTDGPDHASPIRGFN